MNNTGIPSHSPLLDSKRNPGGWRPGYKVTPRVPGQKEDRISMCGLPPLGPKGDGS